MKRWLLSISILLWVEMWVDTLVAVWHKHAYGPYSFGNFGRGHPNDVLGDFIHSNGTALSPPLYLMVVFTIIIVLATRAGRPGLIGVGGLALLAAVFFAGYLIEPITPRVLTPAHAVFPETFLVLLSLATAALVAILASATLLRYRRDHQLGPPRLTD